MNSLFHIPATYVTQDAARDTNSLLYLHSSHPSSAPTTSHSSPCRSQSSRRSSMRRPTHQRRGAAVSWEPCVASCSRRTYFRAGRASAACIVAFAAATCGCACPASTQGARAILLNYGDAGAGG